MGGGDTKCRVKYAPMKLENELRLIENCGSEQQQPQQQQKQDVGVTKRMLNEILNFKSTQK